MRLSVVNFFKKSVNGHIFRGKHRLVKRVTPRSTASLIREYEQTEANMKLLLYPYLTRVSGRTAGDKGQSRKSDLVLTKGPLLAGTIQRTREGTGQEGSNCSPVA